MIKQPINVDFDLNAKVSNSKVIAISHVDDKYNEVLEVNVRQNGAHIDLTGANVIARMVLHAEIDYLLNDNVPCTVSDSGNIMIPFDNAVVKTLQGIVKIEVSITRGEDKLTLQFPLWVSVRGSIIESAEVTPESEGTIPDLLKEATEALEDAKEALEHFGSYSDLTNKPQINDVTLDGDQSADDLGLQKKLTAGQNITIENDGTISASDGVTSYNDLTDKPIIKSKSGLEYPIDGKIILPNFSITNYDSTNKTITYGLNLSGNDLNNSSLPFSKFTQQLQQEVFKDYGEYENPPADLFTNYSVAPAKNGIWYIADGTLQGLPVPVSGRLLNYYCQYERLQIYATDVFLPQDARYQYGGRYFARTQKMGNLGAWVELGGGSEIASGVVNQNGTISFYDKDGKLLFTTTGASVIGPKGDPGDNYVLTAQDKIDIANIVLQSLPTTQGVLYGNASN